MRFLAYENPWRRERLPTPVFWPGELHGLYTLWGHKQLDMTEWLWQTLYSKILSSFLYYSFKISFMAIFFLLECFKSFYLFIGTLYKQTSLQFSCSVVSASTSVLPMNTKDWSPLGWTGWISLQSKGLSRVFSNTTAQKHQFFSAHLSL